MRFIAVCAMAALLTVLATPCVAEPPPQTLHDPSDCPPINGQPLRPEHGTYLDYAGGRLQRQSVFELAAIRDSLLVQRPQTIVIHVHGGLVDRCSAFGDVDRLGLDYRAAGAFPIFVIYHTGPIESTVGGVWNGIGAYPVEDPRAAALFPRLARISRDLKDRENRARVHADPHTTVMEERYRYAPFINVGLYRAGRMWSYMKWVIDQSFHLDSAELDDVPPPASGPYVENAPGGLALAAVLKTYLATASSGTAPPRVMLVGHSTGAIYITKFIRAWHHTYPADTTKFEVVFEAPAIRYDDFSHLFGPRETSAAADLQYPADRIARFRTFTMRDKYESYTPELGSWFAYYFYGPSLLYAISGIFEDRADTPLLGMQRFQCLDPQESRTFADYGAPPPELQMVKNVNAWLSGRFTHPFAYSPAIGDTVPIAFQTQSVTHGGYPHDAHTIASIRALLSNGDNWNVAPPDSPRLTQIESCGYADPTVVVTPPPSPAPPG